MQKNDLEQLFSGHKNKIVTHCFKKFNVKKANWAPATVAANTSRTKIILNYIASKNITNLDLDSVNDLVMYLRVEKKLKNKTLNEYLNLLRLFTSTAKTQKLIDVDPMIHHRTLKTTKRAKKPPMTSEDLLRLLNNDALCPVARILLELHCRLGTRISEILALAWEDFDEKAKVIKIQRALVVGIFKQTKNHGSEREILLNDVEVSLLHRLKKLTYQYPMERIEVLDEAMDGYTTECLKFMFLNLTTGKHYKSVKDYEQVFFKKALTLSGIDKNKYGTNIGRHTFASTSLSSGIPAENVADQMGHRDTEMLRLHYGSLIKEMSSMEEERQSCFDLFLNRDENSIIVDRSKLKAERLSKSSKSDNFGYNHYPPLTVSFTKDKTKLKG